MSRHLLGSIVLVAACGYDADYTGTAYRCVKYPECPDGFTCICGECRIADDYATEVIADAPLAWWRFGERDGLLAADARCSQDAFYEGGPGLAASGLIANSMDTAARFDGVDDKVVTGLQVGAVFTLEALISPTTVPSFRLGFFSAEIYQTSGFRLGITRSGELELWFDESGGAGTISTTPVFEFTEQPHHVAAVVADGMATLFVDGEQRAAGPITYRPTSEPLIIGEAGDLLYFGGTIDEPAIYNVALPGDRLRAHAAASR